MSGNVSIPVNSNFPLTRALFTGSQEKEITWIHFKGTLSWPVTILKVVGVVAAGLFVLIADLFYMTGRALVGGKKAPLQPLPHLAQVEHRPASIISATKPTLPPARPCLLTQEGFSEDSRAKIVRDFQARRIDPNETPTTVEIAQMLTIHALSKSSKTLSVYITRVLSQLNRIVSERPTQISQTPSSEKVRSLLHSCRLFK
jgi:hypothetical protein